MTKRTKVVRCVLSFDVPMPGDSLSEFTATKMKINLVKDAAVAIAVDGKVEMADRVTSIKAAPAIPSQT